MEEYLHSYRTRFRALLRKRDFYAGALMMLFGLVMALKGPGYRVGTLMHMGPGFLPTALGVILICLGIAIAAPAAALPDGEDEDILPEHPRMVGLGLHSCVAARLHPVRLLRRLDPGHLRLRLRGGDGRPQRDAQKHGGAGGNRHRLRRRAVPLISCTSPCLYSPGEGCDRNRADRSLVRVRRRARAAQLMWCFIGVLVGNMVGVLPGMGPLATISILLPLTFGIKPVGAILMLAGVMYGAQYGGAICSILLNLPCHPPHAVTCLDGFPLTKQGKGGVALGLTVFASFVGASWGITEMIFLAPVLVEVALQFGPAEICSLMLLGLLAGSTLARGSPVKGVAMTVLGLMLGIIGTDLETGAERFTFGMTHLADGVELIALALGLFGIAEFMNSVNQVSLVNAKYANVRLRDMRPSKAEFKRAICADVPRHVDRQPVLAHSRHRADHRLVRRLRDGKEDIEDAGEIRHRHDRRRGLPGSRQPIPRCRATSSRP